MRDRGSMLVTVLFVSTAMTAATVAAALPVLGDLVDRQRARAAADAAALAGVHGGRRASGELAAANGAELVTFERSGRAVTVTVRAGDQLARARATDGP